MIIFHIWSSIYLYIFLFFLFNCLLYYRSLKEHIHPSSKTVTKYWFNISPIYSQFLTNASPINKFIYWHVPTHSYIHIYKCVDVCKCSVCCAKVHKFVNKPKRLCESFLRIISELSLFIPFNLQMTEWKPSVRRCADICKALSKRDLSTVIPVSVINDDARNPPSSDHRVCARAHLSKTILMDSS